MSYELLTEHVDELPLELLAFSKPVYVISGDRLNVTSPEYGKITWDINTSMVIFGVRLDGWPVEIIDGKYQSAAYDSISRFDDEEGE
jgi:hypothetical protein